MSCVFFSILAEYKKKKPAAASAEKAHESINKERQIKVQDLAKIQQQLDSCGYNAEEAERVTSERVWKYGHCCSYLIRMRVAKC